MTAFFWLCAGFVAYVYAGYPLLLFVWSRVRSRRIAPTVAPARWPSLSIVIAARDEASRLPHRLQNLIGLSYPGRRQIIVVSDGSTDGSVEALRSYAAQADIVSIERSGKASALNAGVALARHELLVFADARQTFAEDALIELARPFADPAVGGVGGELVLVDSGGSTVADGMGLYWRLEKQLRQFESDVDSMVGATGAIYAIRRSLWKPLPADAILDDVLTPMRCVLDGRRVVFNRRAVAFDSMSRDARAEARRKRRTHAGNCQLPALEPRLLLPWRNRVWLQYVSHKLGRLIVPYALAGLLLSSAALAASSPVYASALVVQCLFYLLAALGALLELADRSRASSSLSLERSWR
jgi:cellulose synthase/poly-beta-1,6-N-acetylglucosamine synthase-like glycosyltransferase